VRLVGIVVGNPTHQPGAEVPRLKKKGAQTMAQTADIQRERMAARALRRELGHIERSLSKQQDTLRDYSAAIENTKDFSQPTHWDGLTREQWRRLALRAEIQRDIQRGLAAAIYQMAAAADIDMR
jgi:hypothetical protein